MPINNASPTSSLKLRSGRVIPKNTGKKSHASVNLAQSYRSDRNDGDIIPTFSFLKLPAELRVRIYRYLLYADGDIYIKSLAADSPEVSKAIFRGRFPDKDCRAGEENYGKMTTYQVNATGVHPALLSVNRQMYLEASKVFYSENCFNFVGIRPSDHLSSNSSIIPFLEDRSEGSRRLIKQIGFGYTLWELLSNPYLPLSVAHFDRVFEETCGYLNQCLQLEHIKLCVCALIPAEIGPGTHYETYLATLDQQNWIQQLVPLVRNLDSIKITETCDDDDDLMRAAQTYLESKMHKASQIVRQSQMVQDLADASAASEK